MSARTEMPKYWNFQEDLETILNILMMHQRTVGNPGDMSEIHFLYL